MASPRPGGGTRKRSAEIAAARRAAGRPLSQADGQIAAIVRSRSMSVATRNVRDFEHTGVDVVDPWQGS